MHKHPIVQHVPAERWWKRSRWILVEDYTGYFGNVVPAGFKFDGVSVPRIFSFLFNPAGKAFEASIIHDYIIETTGDWVKANKQFDAELKASDVGMIRRPILYYAVTSWYHSKRISTNIMNEVKEKWKKKSQSN